MSLRFNPLTGDMVRTPDQGGMLQGWPDAAHLRDSNNPLAGLLLLQLEGDQITGIINGDPVGGSTPWPNIGSSGATNNGTQSNSMKQPTWLAADAAFNGKPSVLHDAADDGLVTGLNLSAAPGYTIIMVVRSISRGGYRAVQSGENNCLVSPDRPGFAVFNGTTIKNDTSATGTDAHILSLAVGAESHFYIDGVDVTEDTGGVHDWGTLCLGGAGCQPETGNCAIAALGAFASVDDTLRQLVELYWRAKYATP